MQGTTKVINQLREEGYQISPGYLQYLLRERILSPPKERFLGSYVWGEEDIERLRRVLQHRSRLKVTEVQNDHNF